MYANRLVPLTVLLALFTSPLLAEDATVGGGVTSQPAEAITKYTTEAGALAILPRLLSGDSGRRETGRRSLDAVIITAALTEILKHAINSRRPAPYQAEEQAFPSGHVSFAFAIAASLSEREPRDAYWAYPLAGAVGWSRHQLNRHTWVQVAGGALLGTYVGMRTGQGQWHLFGHNDASLSEAVQGTGASSGQWHLFGPDSAALSGAGGIEAISSLLLDRQMVLWSSSF